MFMTFVYISFIIPSAFGPFLYAIKGVPDPEEWFLQQQMM